MQLVGAFPGVVVRLENSCFIAPIKAISQHLSKDESLTGIIPLHSGIQQKDVCRADDRYIHVVKLHICYLLLMLLAVPFLHRNISVFHCHC